MNEKLLQFIWQNKLYGSVAQHTTDGKPVEILHPGYLNADAGPDFSEAKIKLEGIVWVGNIEIHVNASDWHKHHHTKDKAYENTILHVIYNADTNIEINKRKVAQLQLNVPNYLIQNYTSLLNHKKWIYCENELSEISFFDKIALSNRLIIERLEQKTSLINHLLVETNNDWSESFYRLLLRNMGFKTNGLPFEMLAKSLPLKTLARHRHQLIQIEALIFGQAGLLKDEMAEDEYYQKLSKEYQFLSKKYGLIPMEASLWKWAKMRPSNFPGIRMAQISQLIFRSENLFSKILELEELELIRELFSLEINEGYWIEHYRFGKKSPQKNKSLGNQSLELILINTIIPMIFAYGKKNQREELMQRAVQFFEKLAPENNQITRNFAKLNFSLSNAADSQALIHLYNNYCQKDMCAACSIGQKIISKKEDV